MGSLDELLRLKGLDFDSGLEVHGTRVAGFVFTDFRDSSRVYKQLRTPDASVHTASGGLRQSKVGSRSGFDKIHKGPQGYAGIMRQ